MVHNVEQEPDQYQGEDNIAMVNRISNYSKSKTSSNQARIIVPYNVDTGSDGNIMPLYVYNNYFLG